MKKNFKRRDFLKKGAIGGTAAVAGFKVQDAHCTCLSGLNFTRSLQG